MSLKVLDSVRMNNGDKEYKTLRTLKEYHIFINLTLKDPDKTGKMLTLYHSQWVVKKNEKLKNFIVRYSNAHNLRQFNLTVSYNHRLYTNGDLTFGDIGMKNNSQIELISLESEKAATENMGFIMSFWSVVPLMIATSFIIGGLGGRFDIIIRGVYILIGTTIGLPSLIMFILGISHKFSKYTRTAFVNHFWFGEPNCKCCGCSNIDDSDSDDLEKTIASVQTNSTILL